MSEFASIVDELRAATWEETTSSPVTTKSRRSSRPAAPPRFEGLGQRLLRFFKLLSLPTLLQAKTRRLRVSETVSLGEKRFISIVEVDGKSFLVGGGTCSVSLLTSLSSATVPEDFALTAAPTSTAAHREVVQ